MVNNPINDMDAEPQDVDADDFPNIREVQYFRNNIDADTGPGDRFENDIVEVRRRRRVISKLKNGFFITL